ncbi:rab-GTPase-TBC domain-domain-containing protein [Clohesyomyces aquaticus]|uniref:Rab-GTPase-TBC domain-domain-containing protein n=1 Tax=Clohesyomyces aquaticus TaxID=1231657 RepID=A0A1Y1ZDT8_9PLEO|nr:rab-GTPase-TBC domain-domain-containing protein [Clohesyomyces aquaticus]
MDDRDTAHADRGRTAERSPRTHVDSQPLPTDSMVTVPLSETDGTPSTEQEDEEATTPMQRPQITVDERRLSSRPTSAELMQAIRERGSQEGSQDGSIHSPSELSSPILSLPGDQSPRTPKSGERSRSDSNASDHSAHVDWVELEKTEEQEPKEEGQDDAMALLLARLEQENNALATDPKSGLKTRARSQSRPPSIGRLKRLVQENDASEVRFSQLPSPPPMTQGEFWAALVRDYPQTVQRLPTLTLNKIRGGIPAPLRGMVWLSASGARDKLLEDQYDHLCGESSPHENIINKDLGRSFPGVEMFRDPEGEGQKMLGRVLKCFSLYDHKVGYCQGLGFLVGPLLMQMGDKEAFCVLVRLMEDYDLRSCFLPDLSGLHLRIFQFQSLLKQHMPKLAAHLDALQIESAYLSQWFLSFFAVTCPLPMLFRIYDVIFAEGASETIMRVALALMKRNEQKILGFSEFEDVMQLLLGRQLWDPYGRNAKSADELVNDFVSFTNDVTRESLQKLEANFREEKDNRESKTSEVQKSATSFLGRLWGPSNSSTKSLSLSPGLQAPSRPLSFLRRTPSKQSLATINSVEGSDSSTSTQSTALTDISRGSSGDALSLKSGHESTALSIRMGHSAKDRDLHYQIEQLLMSVSQLQRQNSELEAALQKQREDRREDHRIVRSVIDRIRTKEPATPSSRASRRRTTITSATLIPPPSTETLPDSALPKDVGELASTLDNRFPTHQAHHRASSMFETKEYLRESLARTKEQLANETARATALARELNDRDTELQIAREALKDTRHRLQDSYNMNQRAEKTIQDLRMSARKGSLPWSSSSEPNNSDTPPALSRSDTADSAVSTNGLRELRLGRSASQKSSHPTTFAKRGSSLATQNILATDHNAPVDNEALLLELVNAKTAEAVARQELEELRGRYEGLKRGLGVQTPSPAQTPAGTTTPPVSGGGVIGGFWGGWKRTVSSSNVPVMPS